MKRVVAAIAFAACRQSPSPSCMVELSGNFSETTRGCPTLGSGAGATRGDTLLHFDLASTTIGGSFAIVIDLGAMPTAGAYNSGTTELWSATGIAHHAQGGACVFQAGNNATPTGDFALGLTAIDRTTAHGVLTIRMFVLPRVSNDGKQTDCGADTTEQLRVRF